MHSAGVSAEREALDAASIAEVIAGSPLTEAIDAADKRLAAGRKPAECMSQSPKTEDCSMSRLLLTLPLLALIAGGCDDQNSQSSAYTQSPVRARPVVTIVPMIDNTNNALCWSVSDEMTTALYHRLSQQDQFYLVDLNQAKIKTRKLHESQNPFGTDISWVKKAFAGDEFVVFMELIEHHEVLRQDRARTMDPKTCAADLNLGMRIRVFDTRGKEVKVILQELIHNSHFVPRQYTHVNFSQAKWGDEGFSISPVGLAHNDFIKEISERLEDYIMLSVK